MLLFLICFFLIRRRMRKRGTGFFFYLEYVWLPLLVLAAVASAWAWIGLDDLADLGAMTLVVVWLISFLVIGLWALILPFAYFAAIPLLWCLAAMVLGITSGNIAGIAWHLWRRRRGDPLRAENRDRRG